jgi:hypothetical protein
MAVKIEIQKVKNVTTTVDVLNLPENHFLQVTEYDDTSVVLIIPLVKIAAGHLVSLQGRIVLDGIEHPFKATGKLEKVMDDKDEKMTRILVRLGQYEKKLWSQVKASSDESQLAIDNLMSSIKGEDL